MQWKGSCCSREISPIVCIEVYVPLRSIDSVALQQRAVTTSTYMYLSPYWENIFFRSV